MRVVYTTMLTINDLESVYAASDREEVLNGEIIGFGDSPEEAIDNWRSLAERSHPYETPTA